VVKRRESPPVFLENKDVTLRAGQQFENMALLYPGIGEKGVLAYVSV
jgi:hypothetical protein